MLQDKTRTHGNLKRGNTLRPEIDFAFMVVMIICSVLLIINIVGKNKHEQLIAAKLEDEHTEVISESLQMFECVGVTR